MPTIINQNVQVPFLPVMPRRFGIELEAKGLSTRDAHSALGQAGLHANHEGHTHVATGGLDSGPWRVVRDGSLTGQAFEAVSPPTTSTHEVWKACRALRAAGARVDRECGTHVHVDATPFNLAQMQAMSKIWLRFERALDALLPSSRRAGHTYCRSNLSGVLDREGASVTASPMDLQVQFNRIDRASTMERLRDYLLPGSSYNRRYHKMNLDAFWRHRTIEFRAHAGTLNGAKLSRWVAICVGMVQAAENGVEVPATEGTLEELMALVRDNLPTVFAEETDVENAGPTSREETYEITSQERTPWTPQPASASGRMVYWFDLVWNGAGSPTNISDELRRQMGVVAAECAQVERGGTVRQAFLRWRDLRIGREVVTQHTRTVTIERPEPEVILDGETFRSWFVAHVNARVVALAA